MLSRILNTFGTRSLSAVINFLIAIVVSQYLGPGGKGAQGIIITTIAFVLVFSNLVGGATLVYLIPRFKYSLLLLPSYLWSVFVSIIAFGLLYFFRVVDQQFIVHISALSILNSFTNINATLLIGKEKIKASNLISLMQPFIVIMGLLYYFLIAGQESIQSYIHSLYFAFGGSLLISFYYINRVFGKINLHSVSSYATVISALFRLGFMNQMAHITQMMSFRLSYYFLEQFHGEASVGIYSNGIQIMESIWLISKSISLVQYARIANTADRKYAQQLSLNMLKAGISISLISILPLLLLPESFYLFIFGKGFTGVKEVIWVLAPGVLVYNVSIILGHYFSGIGKYYINTLASGLGLLISIGLFFALIPSYVTLGAGIATSISYGFTSMVVLIFFMREAKSKAKDFILSKKDIVQLRELIRKQKN
ncbi:MAG: polysaccharide biosynthesis C-terminal domain-containing protein [Bacteroidales bacterium]|nr:polysaccharide biosynthesis C-terminal domain-containing protein [Bacteroidales bacterium]